MKKIFLYIAITLGLLSCNHKDSLWQEIVEDLDERVETLEMLCAEMNTNITSLQTIVDVLQSNDFITSIVEIKKDGKVVGYTITFGKHDPITIYHGQDGKDGQNGTNGKDGADGKDGQDGQNGDDGKDGSTPVIGVAQDTDGVYYWTLNGEWLLDDNGNKLPVSGKNGQNGANGSNGQDGADGKDGQDGEDGKDGADGQDGKDGITPQLKIEEGYWYISYDNGATWTQLGKATGEDGKDGVDGENGKDGQNGADGKDGQDGDSMFQSVTQDKNYVYFTLADGTIIKIAKGTTSTEEQPNSEFMFIVTYDANGGAGVIKKDTFYYGCLKSIRECTYVKEGYHCKIWNTKADGTGISYKFGRSIIIDKNITLYAQWYVNSGVENNYEWVDLGLSVKWATMNVGASKPEDYGGYFAWGEIEAKKTFNWSNYEGNEGYSEDNMTLEPKDDAATVNWGNSWRMPTREEAKELSSDCTWEEVYLNGVKCVKITSKTNGNCIFLPCPGYIYGATLHSGGTTGWYWTSSLMDGSHAYYMTTSQYYGSGEPMSGHSIRPVLVENK